MKYPNYPSPCLTCERQQRCDRTVFYMNCQEWQTWWRWWWKYFQQNLGKDEPGSAKSSKFQYEHPDIIRKELEKNPCEGCLREEFCATPCYKYLAWWDARMHIFRKKVGL